MDTRRFELLTSRISDHVLVCEACALPLCQVPNNCLNVSEQHRDTGSSTSTLRRLMELETQVDGTKPILSGKRPVDLEAFERKDYKFCKTVW